MILEPIIGLEIHVQLKTASKMFCSCSNAGEDMPPNTTVCPICLGHPGTLPVPNDAAIWSAVRAALALKCKINEWVKFDRKNYFYPDLPKGYQISQLDKPIGEHGAFTFVVDGEERMVGITRLHLEEDAAKLLHHGGDGTASLVDFNRAGTPLLEIVTEPDFRSPHEAKIFMQELRLVMRHLEVSDADMEKGHLRCDANISLRPLGEDSFFPKTEIKNINSFRFVERALVFEIARLTALWDRGKPPMTSSTRGWDEARSETVEQRTKEASDDYRYFPEPDIPYLEFTEEYLNILRAEIPELPSQRRERFQNQHGLSAANARILADDQKLAAFTEEVFSELRAWLEAREDLVGTSDERWEQAKASIGHLVGGWLVSKLLGLIAEKGAAFSEIKVTAEDFAEFITFIFEKKINSHSAQSVLRSMVATGVDPHVIIEEQGLAPLSDDGALEDAVRDVIVRFPVQAAEYRAGKTAVKKFFVGQLMKETKGQADPIKADEAIEKFLAASSRG